MAMCRWLDHHVGNFLAMAHDADGALSYGKFGPLGELSLALVGLTAPRYALSVPKVHDWAATLAQALQLETVRLAASLRWDSYEAALDRNLEAGVAWMFIPATELAAGAPTGFRNRLTDPLGDRSAIIATPDALLFLELLGVRDCTTELDRLLRDVVDRTLAQVGLPCCPDLYDATHAIFYLTRFGRLPGRCRRLSIEFRDRLCAAAVRQADEGDIDLAAEIVASLLYAGFPMDRRIRQICRSIVGGIGPDGGVVTTRGQASAVSKDFRCRYHPTLVALMALVEAQHAVTRS
jgi:hypothetical protein